VDFGSNTVITFKILLTIQRRIYKSYQGGVGREAEI